MNGSQGLLPAGFAPLEPFVAAWAVDGAANRLHRRLLASASERGAFFTAAADLLPSALDYLDRKPLSQFDEQETRLMNMLLSLCHVSLAVEIQGDDEVRHALLRQHMKIARASADEVVNDG
jgi:hypothetical protein